MRVIAKIDMTAPADTGEYVEIETPAGTVRVHCGLIQPRTGHSVVLIEIEEAQGWPVEVKRDRIMGRTDVRQVQE